MATPQREEPVSLEKVLRDLQRAGIHPTGGEIDERDLKRAWLDSLAVLSGLPSIAPASMPSIAPIARSEQLELFAA